MNKIKLENVKLHVKNNKATYITGGVCLVVGALGGGAYALTRPEVQQVVKNQGAVIWKPVQHVTQIVLTRAGNAGNVFQDMDNAQVWMSTRQLMDDLGVTQSAVKNYLEGKTPDLAGRQIKLLVDGAGEILLDQSLAA